MSFTGDVGQTINEARSKGIDVSEHEKDNNDYDKWDLVNIADHILDHVVSEDAIERLLSDMADIANYAQYGTPSNTRFMVDIAKTRFAKNR